MLVSQDIYVIVADENLDSFMDIYHLKICYVVASTLYSL